MSRLTLRLLGSPRVERDGAPIVVDTRKAIALLVYLAMTEGQHRRDVLAALLWPDYDQDHARAALRRTLSALNRALQGHWLKADRSIVALASDSLWLDVREFRDLIAASRGHGHPAGEACPACIQPLTRAAALYRGDFLAGFALRDSPTFDEWQSFEAETLRGELAGVLELLARGHGARGDFDAAVEAGRRWLALDPLHEPAHRELMRLYAWSGRRNAALRQYRECVRVLDRELGVAPLPETTGLYQAINQGDLPSGEVARRREEVVPPRAGPARPPAYPLVGRGREWARLLEVYASIEADGRLVALEGEAGIGKSRLAEEFVWEASRRGAATVTTKAHEGEDSLAYALFVEALRALVPSPDALGRLGEVPERWASECARLVPELADVRPDLTPAPPLESPGARSRFFEGVVQTLLAACASPVPAVLFFDDLQWADAATLDLLAYLARRLRGRPVCLVLAWRTEDVGEGHRLRRMLGDVLRAGTGSLIRLPRLSHEEVVELLEAAMPPSVEAPPGLDEQLYRETEGLPFFLVEYLAALEQDGALRVEPGWIPGGMRELIRSRVTVASEAARQLLSAAAVIGKSFDFDLLRKVSGRSEEEAVAALEELIRRGLVHEVGDERPSYDFSHEKLREVVYAETKVARRRLLHARAAEALVARGRGQLEGSALVARHFQRAGNEQQAALFFKLAGEHASSLFANAEALAHFHAALALGHPETGALHEAIGDLQTLGGDYAAAATSYEAAAAQSAAGDLGRIEHKLGRLHHRRGDWELAESHFRAALEELGDESTAERASLFADRSLNAHRRGEEVEALALATRALELADEAGDLAALARAHNILGVLATRRGDASRAREHLKKSVSLSEGLSDPSARVAALNNLALAQRTAGATAEAVELTERALTFCASQGDRHREAALHNNLADLLREQGRSEEAMAHLKTAVAIFAEIGEPGAMEPEIWKLVEW